MYIGIIMLTCLKCNIGGLLNIHHLVIHLSAKHSSEPKFYISCNMNTGKGTCCSVFRSVPSFKTHYGTINMQTIQRTKLKFYVHVGSRPTGLGPSKRVPDWTVSSSLWASSARLTIAHAQIKARSTARM
jgi:hypothetical protein